MSDSTNQSGNEELPVNSSSGENMTMDPPKDFWGIVKQLGPGLIIAGNIVGSGELVATTKTGAESGIVLLWLVIVGCVIKVFAQIELGRYTLSSGQTTLKALDTVPGPRLVCNWIIWFWLLMMLAGIFQLGGIVGGVGQAAAIAMPFTGDYAEAADLPSEKQLKKYFKWDEDFKSGKTLLMTLPEKEQERVLRGFKRIHERIESLSEKFQGLVEDVRQGKEFIDPIAATYDAKIWAALITIFTSTILYIGRYNMIQNVTTFLVVSFSLITMGNVMALQTIPEWRISMSDFFTGLSFNLPVTTAGKYEISTALAAFGIIGVGAGELIAYPYWCMEKGYAKFTGPKVEGEEWGKRARGWMQVMRYDAFTSMLIYTIATVAFFLMGVAVLHHEGLDPDGMRMVSTIAEAYVPVFGEYSRWLFLIGAIAVLYSTFLVANAANARMYADGFRVFKIIDPDSKKRHGKIVIILSVILPFMSLITFCMNINPVKAILIAGAIQALMLPMLGFAALYFRFKRIDQRLRPGHVWDILLVLSFLGLLLAGGWKFYEVIEKILKMLS